MSRSRLVALVVALSAMVSVLSPAPAFASSCRHVVFDSTGSTCDHAIDWRYDPVNREFTRDGKSRLDRANVLQGPRYDWERRERCGSTGSTCGAAALTCVENGVRGYRYAVYGYRLNANGQRVAGPAEIVTTECVYPQQVVPLATVQAVADQRIRKLVGHPHIQIAPPGGRTLVNIPTVYSTTRYDDVTLPIATPVPGQITAVAQYTWTFEGHQHALGPGAAYDPAFDPITVPDHYVHTVYDRPGAKVATVALSWQVHFALQDVVDVELAPITFTATATTEAVTAKNQLIAGDS